MKLLVAHKKRFFGISFVLIFGLWVGHSWIVTSVSNLLYPTRVVTELFPTSKNDPILNKLIADWANSQPVKYSIKFDEISKANDDKQYRYAEYQSSESMVPASIYKLFVVYAALSSVEDGKYSLQSNMRSGNTVSRCIELSLKISDNACAEELGFMLGWENINTLIKSNGFSRTNVNNYRLGSGALGDKQTTANDLSRYFKYLANNTLLSKSDSNLILEHLKNQVWRERIPAGVPDGIVVADKPGWLDNIQTDAGIIYGPKSTYSLVILSTANSPKPLAELSKIIYDYTQK